jgi:hypothetical protein
MKLNGGRPRVRRTSAEASGEGASGTNHDVAARQEPQPKKTAEDAEDAENKKKRR